MFGEKFSTMAGVHLHFSAQGIEPEQGVKCGGCQSRERPVYPWPLPGFGVRCAMCIVIESREPGPSDGPRVAA